MNRTILIIGLLLGTLVSGSVFAGTAQQACEEKKQAIESQKNRKKDVENQMKDIDNQIDSVRQQIKALEDRINTLKAQKRKEKDKNKQGDIENQIKDVQNQITALKQRIVALEDRKNTKKAEIAQINSEIKKLEKEARKVCDTGEKCEAQKTKLDGFKKMVKDLKMNADRVRRDIQKKKVAVGKFDKKVTAERALSDKLKCGNMPSDTSPEVIAQCNKNYDEWTQDIAAMRDLDKEINSLRIDLQKLNTTNTRVMGKVSAWYKLIVKHCAGDSVVAEAEKLNKTDVGMAAMTKMHATAKKELRAVRNIRLPKPKVNKARVKKPVQKK